MKTDRWSAKLYIWKIVVDSTSASKLMIFQFQPKKIWLQMMYKIMVTRVSAYYLSKLFKVSIRHMSWARRSCYYWLTGVVYFQTSSRIDTSRAELRQVNSNEILPSLILILCLAAVTFISCNNAPLRSLIFSNT